jgi:hypothetical protein
MEERRRRHHLERADTVASSAAGRLPWERDDAEATLTKLSSRDGRAELPTLLAQFFERGALVHELLSTRNTSDLADYMQLVASLLCERNGIVLVRELDQRRGRCSCMYSCSGRVEVHLDDVSRLANAVWCLCLFENKMGDLFFVSSARRRPEALVFSSKLREELKRTVPELSSIAEDLLRELRVYNANTRSSSATSASLASEKEVRTLKRPMPHASRELLSSLPAIARACRR